MRAVVQRVSQAQVRVDGRVVGEIACGLLVLLGVGQEDDLADSAKLADKVAGLRIFSDEAGRMNLSVGQVGGAVLVVSQFTLWGDASRGRRPSYGRAAPPERALPLYHHFVEELGLRGLTVATGEFGAMMQVALVNSGPVTLLLDTQGQF